MYYFIFGYGEPAVAELNAISISPMAQTACDYKFENYYSSHSTEADLLCFHNTRQKKLSPMLINLETLKCHQNIYSALSRQFDALRSLSAGWYDGAGKAPDSEALDTIENWLLEFFPSALPVPAIVPTPEGDLLLEWSGPGEPSVDIQLSDLHASFHAFSSDGTDLERTFDLQSYDERAHFLTFLRETVGSVGA